MTDWKNWPEPAETSVIIWMSKLVGLNTAMSDGDRWYHTGSYYGRTWPELLDYIDRCGDGTPPRVVPEPADELQARLDAVLALHHAVECEPSETICAGCSTLRGTSSSARYFPYTEYPCPTVKAARGEQA